MTRIISDYDEYNSNLLFFNVSYHQQLIERKKSFDKPARAIKT